MRPRVGPSSITFMTTGLAATVCWGKQMTGQHKDLGHGFHPRYRPRFGLTKDLEAAEHNCMSNRVASQAVGFWGRRKD